MLTLEKFEEASELVKRVTNPTKLVYSDYLSEQCGGKVYLKPEICSIQALIRSGARIIKSARLRMRKEKEG